MMLAELLYAREHPYEYVEKLRSEQSATPHWTKCPHCRRPA